MKKSFVFRNLNEILTRIPQGRVYSMNDFKFENKIN